MYQWPRPNDRVFSSPDQTSSIVATASYTDGWPFINQSWPAEAIWCPWSDCWLKKDQPRAEAMWRPWADCWSQSDQQGAEAMLNQWSDCWSQDNLRRAEPKWRPWSDCRSQNNMRRAHYSFNENLYAFCPIKLNPRIQWRTQEFCSGGFNKFSWGQRTKRTWIWGR
jgi:hypothetical protein